MKKKINDPLTVVIVAGIIFLAGLLMIGTAIVYYRLGYRLYSITVLVYGVYLVLRYGLTINRDMRLIINGGMDED